MSGRSNPGLASDLVVASRLAEGAAHGAVVNVLVNLPSLGDPAAAESLEAQCNRLARSVASLGRSARATISRRALREPEAPAGKTRSSAGRATGAP